MSTKALTKPGTAKRVDTAAGTEFRLVARFLREPAAEEGSRARLGPAEQDRETHDFVVVPEGVSALHASDGVLPDAVAPTNLPDADAPLLETIRRDQRRQLMLYPTQHHCLRLNGFPTGPLAVLREGDVLQWSPDVLFQVAIYNRPQIGAPSEPLIGKACPVCTVPFTAETRIYVCSHCGAGLHHEEPADGLHCATLSRTCSCGHEINFNEGYSTSVNPS
jgi:hypothetical protein